MILLDTDTVSALMRGDEVTKSRLLTHRRTEVALPQPVVAEIEYGLARLPASRRRTRLIERWRLVSGELLRVEWTDEVSGAFGRVKAALEREGRPIEDFDIAIAAHAIVHNATLITSNLSYFERITGLAVEDWNG